MPGKGRRVASRQAELGRRRRRQNRGSGAVNGGPSVKASPDTLSGAVATEEQLPATQVNKTEAPTRPRPAPAVSQRNTSRARLDRPAAYNYVVPELRRILIMSGVLVAVLVALSFFI